jgi:hypothetical protein
MADTKTMTPQLAFSLAVAGAGYEYEGRTFHDQMVREKRIFASCHLTELDLAPEEKFSVLQSMIIYNFCGLFHTDPERKSFFSNFAHEERREERENDADSMKHIHQNAATWH